MKYLFCPWLLAAIIFGCASFTTGNEAFYEGAAMGYREMIHVRVGMEDGVITEITVIESSEDPAIGGAAIEELIDLVMMYNTTEIDAVSGATETSRGFLEAVENAIFSP
jgi:fumarate reductase flavoprotein subunit